jgi:hypothetical protein
MRSAGAAGLLAAAVVLAGGAANAQAPQSGKKPYKPQPLNLQRFQDGSAHFADVGRERMRRGDCAGALEAFDMSLRTSKDPTVHRDRGLCHEKLGDPYPAIDDYRVYLTAVPDASDADGIRARLAKLEQETTGKSSAPTDDDVPPSAAASGSASVSATGDGVQASSSSGSSSGGSPERNALDDADRDGESRSSSLRRGKGWGLAPFFAEHKWLASGTSFGDATTWSESVGLQVRYSFGHLSSVFVEAGYERFNGSDLGPGFVSGLTSQAAWELRLPIDADDDNQLIIAPGIGYEHLVLSVDGTNVDTIDAIVPRARFGYRRMLAESGGIDFALDGGIAQTLGSGTLTGNGRTAAFLGLEVALVWGL